MCEPINRYSTNGFTRPDHLFRIEQQKSELDSCASKALMYVAISTSLCFAAYINNAHDRLMASDSCAALKFAGVVLLEVANLANTALAAAEIIPRIAIAILAFPFYICSENSEDSLLELLVKLAVPMNVAGVPGGFIQAWDMISSTENQKPGSKKILEAVCGKKNNCYL